MAAKRRASSTGSTRSARTKASAKKSAAKTTNGRGSERPTSSRGLWSGSLAFGLVLIPVTLHTAERRSGEIHFRLLDKNDMSPIRYQRVNAVTGEPVDWKDIVKGYEIEKDELVVVDPDDLKKANVRATQTIEIQDFVPMDEIDPAYFVAPYYLVPSARGSKAYALLHATLAKKKAAAVATFVLRTREHLCAVMPVGDQLMLEILRFDHELRPASEMPATATAGDASSREIAMAERLVEGMMTTWDPARYKDRYHDDVMAMIEEKAAHGKVTQHHAEERGAVAANVVDLLELLKKSVKQGPSNETTAGEGGSRDAHGPRPRGIAKARPRGKRRHTAA